MSNNRNSGRKKKLVSGKGSIKKRGEGLGTGPVGSGNGPKPELHNVIQELKEQQDEEEKDHSGPISRGPSVMTRSPRGGSSGIVKLILIVLVLFIALYMLKSCFSGGTTPINNNGNTSGEAGERDSFYEYFTGNTVSQSGWNLPSNVGSLNSSVYNGARAKRTTILGNGQDKITLMVYMCGTDLESKYGMATSDLMEMTKATISDNINLIVYTGGCAGWKNDVVSTRNNQIYRVRAGGVENLVSNAGSGAMTDPATLLSFLDYCKNNFEANRYQLIFWDHGGGSITGYGYDEKYARTGSMDLAEMDQALTEAGIEFDFIGFDTCLMATTETALMLTEHADYMIGSEESEPGIGWYYTDWLTKLSQNTSMPTVEIGKNICDDFVKMCNQQCPGQGATLSVVDLAEAEVTIPEALAAFSESANQLLANNDYRTIAKARSGAREYAAESGVDMVDFVDMINKIGTDEAKALSDRLLSCIKYNNTSADMANSYGLSIYFPYRSMKYVNSALQTYSAIGMDEGYSNVVRNFATTASTGQIASGGTSSAYGALTGGNSYNTESYNYSTQASTELLYQLLEAYLANQLQQQQQQSYSNYYGDAFSFLFGRDINTRNLADMIVDNHFDADLTWKDGKINLTQDQWSMVNDLKLNAYYDDGEGYIELGSDNVFYVDEEGNLVGEPVETWLSINGQIIPYHYMMTTSGYIIGRVPVLLNGELANLILVCTNSDNPEWSIAGATVDYYDEDNQGIIPKNIVNLEEGDTLDFVCDYYAYDGTYQDSYLLGEQLVVSSETPFEIGDMELDDPEGIYALYQFTDIYNQNYWTAPLQ